MKAQRLFIYPDARLQRFSWLYIDQGERLPTQEGDFSELQQWAANIPRLSDSHVVVILPVESALHTVVTVPRKQRRFLQRSLPFILEDQIAQDIEDLHIVPGTNLPDEQVGVYAIPHARVRQLIDLCENLQLRLAQLALDTQIIGGRHSDRLTLLWQGDRVLISARGRGLACTRQDVSSWLERLIPESYNDLTVQLLVSPEHDTDSATLTAELAQSYKNQEPPRVVADGWLGTLADLWLEQTAVRNLLTAPYEPANTAFAWQKFIPGSALAASLLVVGGGLYFVANLLHTESRANATWAAAEQIFDQAAPDNMTFSRTQYRQAVETALLGATSDNGEATFLALLADIDSALSQDSLSLEELRYTGDRREIQMQVVGGSTQDLETFRDELEARQLSVTYSANRLDEGFRGNYRLQANGGG